MPIGDAGDEPFLPDLDDHEGGLQPSGRYDGSGFRGLQLTGDAAGARFLECGFFDCELHGLVLDRSRLSSCRIEGSEAAGLPDRRHPARRPRRRLPDRGTHRSWRGDHPWADRRREVRLRQPSGRHQLTQLAPALAAAFGITVAAEW